MRPWARLRFPKRCRWRTPGRMPETKSAGESRSLRSTELTACRRSGHNQYCSTFVLAYLPCNGEPAISNLTRLSQGNLSVNQCLPQPRRADSRPRPLTWTSSGVQTSLAPSFATLPSKFLSQNQDQRRRTRVSAPHIQCDLEV